MFLKYLLQADAAMEEQKAKIRTPPTIEDIQNVSKNAHILPLHFPTLIVPTRRKCSHVRWISHRSSEAA